MSQTASTVPAKSTDTKTAYAILRESDDALDVTALGTWSLVAKTVNAASAEAAIRKYTSERTNETAGGTYIAIPARSWKPVTVKTETRTVVTLENA